MEALLTHKFCASTFIFRAPLITFLLLGRRKYSTGCRCELIYSTLSQRGALLLADNLPDRISSAAIRVWLKTETARISRGHQHISFHNTHVYPFNHVTTSTYFRSCVLCRESLIDGSVTGQYATIKCKCASSYIFMVNKNKAPQNGLFKITTIKSLVLPTKNKSLLDTHVKKIITLETTQLFLKELFRNYMCNPFFTSPIHIT